MNANQIDGVVFVISLLGIFILVVMALRSLRNREVQDVTPKQRVYICGPMTGIPDYNYPAFNECAEQLREIGFHVENPAKNPVPDCGSYNGYMRMSIAQLVKCDQVVLLPGWINSKGAKIEVDLARALEIPLTDWTPDHDWLNVREFALKNGA
jgi:hypothetical protein